MSNENQTALHAIEQQLVALNTRLDQFSNVTAAMLQTIVANQARLDLQLSSMGFAYGIGQHFGGMHHRMGSPMPPQYTGTPDPYYGYRPRSDNNQSQAFSGQHTVSGMKDPYPHRREQLREMGIHTQPHQGFAASGHNSYKGPRLYDQYTVDQDGKTFVDIVRTWTPTVFHNIEQTQLFDFFHAVSEHVREYTNRGFTSEFIRTSVSMEGIQLVFNMGGGTYRSLYFSYKKDITGNQVFEKLHSLVNGDKVLNADMAVDVVLMGCPFKKVVFTDFSLVNESTKKDDQEVQA